ncbi:hypothetical protein ACRCUN_30525 [Mycobacterium sp. LTG2003]
MRRARVAICLLVCLAGGAACVRTSDGVPVAAESSTMATASPPETYTPPPSNPAPGIVESSRAPLPSNVVTCSPREQPAVAITAEVADPHAPKITVPIPDGWTPELGSGDVGARLSGPDGMSATVRISQTALDPVAAFGDYADRIIAQATVSSVSMLPAVLCGYSGQKLTGIWSNNPDDAVEFTDRLVHIWTNDQNYLVAVAVRAPTATAGFDGAAAALIADFGVRIP